MDAQTKAATLMIKGIISEMPEEAQQAVQKCADKLRKVIAKHGDPGLIALSLVTAETMMEQ